MRNLFLIKININRAGIFPLKYEAILKILSLHVPGRVRLENFSLDYIYIFFSFGPARPFVFFW